MKTNIYVMYLHNHSPIPSKMVFTRQPEDRDMHCHLNASELVHATKSLLLIGALNIINSN